MIITITTMIIIEIITIKFYNPLRQDMLATMNPTDVNIWQLTLSLGHKRSLFHQFLQIKRTELNLSLQPKDIDYLVNTLCSLFRWY
jgi:hypothetical protein